MSFGDFGLEGLGFRGLSCGDFGLEGLGFRREGSRISWLPALLCSLYGIYVWPQPWADRSAACGSHHVGPAPSLCVNSAAGSVYADRSCTA